MPRVPTNKTSLFYLVGRQVVYALSTYNGVHPSSSLAQGGDHRYDDRGARLLSTTAFKPGGVRGGLHPGGPKLEVVLLKEEEETIVVEIADKVPQDRDLEVQVAVEIESGGEEVSQVAERGNEINVKAQALESSANPVINDQEVGGSPIPTTINNPPNLSFFEVSNLSPLLFLLPFLQPHSLFTSS